MGRERRGAGAPWGENAVRIGRTLVGGVEQGVEPSGNAVEERGEGAGERGEEDGAGEHESVFAEAKSRYASCVLICLCK